MLSSNTSAVSGDTVYVEDVFSTYLYTGNGNSARSISNGIDLSTKGGMVWLKNRTNAYYNNLFDTARGVEKRLYSNTTDAQVTTSGSLTAFNTDGFSLGTASFGCNDSGDNIASWTFRKQPKFFDVVTYTGTGVARTIAHNLGSVPGCIITKCTSGVNNWYTYHRSLGNTNEIRLNQTAAAASGSLWNSTDPTSTVFSLGASSDVNSSGATYVAYLFAHDAGGFGLTGTDNVISCGSFTTDGSSNVTVTLGYEPQYLLVKAVSGSSPIGQWRIYDSMRGFTSNPSTTTNRQLRANATNAEETARDPIVTPTGFQSQGYTLDPSTTYIYIAIRRGPMKVPTDATKVFTADATFNASGTTAASPAFDATFPVDLLIRGLRVSSSSGSVFTDRLRGTAMLDPSAISNETTVGNPDGGFKLDLNNGAYLTSPSAGVSTWYVGYQFRRAPSFFDEVCYTGDGNIGRTVSHNLGVAPELMIIKRRDTAGYLWRVYNSPTTALELNTTAAQVTDLYWNNTAPTSSVFTLYNYGQVNASGGTYVAYLFATCAGVSKVGTYTGNGTSQTINCGFAAGARFILIKRTDSTGDWYVWDTARGIVAGNDQHLSLNNTNAEVTTDDSIDTDSSGFVVNQLAATNVNVNAATYIFLAIA